MAEKAEAAAETEEAATMEAAAAAEAAKAAKKAAGKAATAAPIAPMTTTEKTLLLETAGKEEKSTFIRTAATRVKIIHLHARRR